MASETTFTMMKTKWETGVKSIIIEWGCGAGASADFDEDFPENVMDFINGWKCIMAVTIPGNHAKCAGTEPTALYDIEILDEYDVDIFGGQLKDRSSTLSEQTTPLVDTALMSRPVTGDLTFILENNGENDANGFTRLDFEV
jgi:hypothetical protein